MSFFIEDILNFFVSYALIIVLWLGHTMEIGLIN